MGEMANRQLLISVMSADGLKNVNWISKMKPYVVVSVGGVPSTKSWTRVDWDGGRNPRWNDRLSFPFDAAAINNLYLVFDIKTKRRLGDRDVGRVTVPLGELLGSSDAAAERVVERQVRRPSGKLKGSLRFSYKVGDGIEVSASPVGEPVDYPHHNGPGPAAPRMAWWGTVMVVVHDGIALVRDIVGGLVGDGDGGGA